MSKKVLKRNEVNELHTWDLKRLYKEESLYEKDVEKLERLVEQFVKKYFNNLNTANSIVKALDMYQEILKLFTYTSTYQSLHSSVDRTDNQNLERSGKYGIISNELSSKLTFFNSALLETEDSVLDEVVKLNKGYQYFIENVKRDKKHKINPEIEQALSEFQPIFSLPYSNYNSFKFGDMTFDNFKANNKELPNSFTMFENEWSYDTNHEIRRKAFESFYNDLGKYQVGLANNYAGQVLKERGYAKLKGFDSTIKSLLFNQKVTEEMYDRQIDLIMEHLSKPMHKYAELIKEVHGLDKLTYADLHLSIDPEYEPAITIEEARDLSIESLNVLGEEYTEMVRRSFDERWIDFPQNLGKSTGGFCSSPYQKGSFILLNWNGQMNEAFVLAHELGHAGHFYYASKHQGILDNRPSMYFIEAPSTMNELLMADHLLKDEKDLRFRRYVLSNIVSRTYYHNMVTHLLEAHYQREVYRNVDSGKPINFNVLNNLKLNTLKTFWQDTVEIPEYAGLTWMRQPHYFMGLYPYTYSAGLTIATKVYSDIKKGRTNYSDWLEVLKAGGTKNPMDLAKMVGVDLSTEEPLMDAIKTVSDMIDEIVEITKKLGK